MAQHDYRVAILGAGPIGCATAAFLTQQGIRAGMWSPTARRLQAHDDSACAQFECTGAVNGSVVVDRIDRLDRLADYSHVFVCLPGSLYQRVLADAAPFWRTGQTVIVSGALSLVPLWIQNEARARGAAITAVGWGTTLTTAHFLSDGRLHLNAKRQRIDMAVLRATNANADGNANADAKARADANTAASANTNADVGTGNATPASTAQAYAAKPTPAADALGDIDLAVPASPHATDQASRDAFADCQAFFGDRFVVVDSLLASTLANINPIAHAAEVIPNLTRMDRGEDWPLFGCFTGVVARMADALDQERLALASHLGFELPTLVQHYHRSYHVAPGPLNEMAQAIEDLGAGPLGPNRLAHRYVLEDVPFGLAFQERLARICGVDSPMLSACITLLETIYAQSFRRENFLMDALLPDQGLASLDGLLASCRSVRAAS